MDDLDDLEKKTMQIFGGRTDGRDGDGVREEGEYGKERGRVREVREGGINQLVGPAGIYSKAGGGGQGHIKGPI